MIRWNDDTIAERQFLDGSSSMGDVETACIHRVLEAQAMQAPDSIALVFENQPLTYRELDRRANQLAHHLRELGVGKETLVGICLERSMDMVIAMFAVLKAGGAYIPLDPSYPKERLSLILQDSQARVVITHQACTCLFGERDIDYVCLDDWTEVERLPATPPAVDVSMEQLAYVIYTSGSTGQPKGVMIPHASLSHFVRLAGSVLDVTANDIYLQNASIAYALSVRQIMIPLASGATLVLANIEQMHDPLQLFRLVKEQHITSMDMVPSFWRASMQRLSQLPADEGKALLDNALRRIVSIGEPLCSDIPQEWMHRFGCTVQLINILGQTETTGVVATYDIPSEVNGLSGIVPIGYGIPETKLYILDENLEPVPPGEVGELCVSNPCLARGYWNRPELTAQKFILNPFQDGLSRYLYRSGDLARQRQDGALEFLGRSDQQVKIRGQRLELGEVEMVLRRHPAVRDCAVLAQGDQPDGKQLAAYIVAVEKSLTATAVRDFLKRRLPDYMVPSAIGFLESLPLTPNGKIDRLALPGTAAIASYQPANAYVAPRNRTEQIIAAIWMDLLKLNRVGIHDNYFDLGGHSLLSVQMFARIERDLGVRLPFTSLFHAATIAELAKLVECADDDVTGWKILVPVQPYGDKPPFFGVHAHEGGVLFWRDIASYIPDDQPFYALQAVGVDGIQAPLRRIPDMASLYIQEIRKIQPQGPYSLGGYSMGGEIAFEMAQQLVRQGETVCLLVLFDTRNPKRSIRPMAREDGSIVPELDALQPIDRFSIVKRKLQGHYLRLSALSPAYRAAYLLNQVDVRRKRFTTKALVQCYQTLRKRLPDALLLHYLRECHSEALTNYVPSVYPGKITLFRASETLPLNPDDSPLGWGPLAAGGLEVHHFEASHEIVNAKYAKVVAQKLNECLERARSLS